ncbi:hypothetical protein AAFF_G00066560 [Aldrovandia affinis]|uniref:Uncharacterized protein n=1 Tax=Aldrovandia affinis TaxID=143900 RepID=A0AAD7WYX8_9TELE|nr:hypothetical protein AAFF_G00066560 [Aldrovandia affinis]
MMNGGVGPSQDGDIPNRRDPGFLVPHSPITVVGGQSWRAWSWSVSAPEPGSIGQLTACLYTWQLIYVYCRTVTQRRSPSRDTAERQGMLGTNGPVSSREK